MKTRKYSAPAIDGTMCHFQASNLKDAKQKAKCYGYCYQHTQLVPGYNPWVRPQETRC